MLYRLVEEAAGLNAGDTLLDLFCGTGTIGLSLAHRAREVLGFRGWFGVLWIGLGMFKDV